MNSISSCSSLRKCKLCQQEKPHSIQGVYAAPVCVDCMQTLPPVPEGMKRCAQCLNPFPVTGRRYSWCTTCRSTYAKQRYNAEAKRDKNLRSNYNGFTQEDYDLMFFQQGGVCAICKQPETKMLRGKLKPLDVDHNHQTDQVRELLCHRCNLLVRDMEQGRDLVKKALAYLKKHDT